VVRPADTQAVDGTSGEEGRDNTLTLFARGITKSFDGKFANEDVDLELRGGEIHALLGENGAGKTTLISVLCGQYKADSGAVEIDGEVHHFASPRDALRAGIGVVHQDLRQITRFSVIENVILGSDHGVSREAEKKVEEIGKGLGFELDAKASVGSLSVGERQQLEIIKLLYRGSRILILDEPTAVLAPEQSRQLFDALHRLAGEGKAIVFVSHRLREVTEAADRVTVLRHGRVVAKRPVEGADPAELAALMVGDDAEPPLTVTPGKPAEPMLVMKDARCGSGRRALSGVDLTVHRGEIVGVAGVSGNGQVELAEAAAGMRRLDKGQREDSAEQIAFIPEDRLATGLVGSMSIEDNLAFRRYARGPMSSPLFLRRSKIRTWANELIERFAVPTNRPQLNVAALSGGGLQRVIIAREISEQPDLLVASQPTRGLDVVSAAGVRAQIVAARDAGAGCLVVSEDLDELLHLSDRIVVMLGGQIVAMLERGEADRATLGRRMTGVGDAEVAA
jgi:general nucleoside transport system ATP-binding protein